MSSCWQFKRYFLPHYKSLNSFFYRSIWTIVLVAPWNLKKKAFYPTPYEVRMRQGRFNLGRSTERFYKLLWCRRHSFLGAPQAPGNKPVPFRDAGTKLLIILFLLNWKKLKRYLVKRKISRSVSNTVIFIFTTSATKLL